MSVARVSGSVLPLRTPSRFSPPFCWGRELGRIPRNYRDDAEKFLASMDVSLSRLRVENAERELVDEIQRLVDEIKATLRRIP